MIYILKHRAQHLLVWIMHFLKLGNLPIIGDFLPTVFEQAFSRHATCQANAKN
jgi:hypothetical protein